MKLLFFAETFLPATRGGVASATYYLCRALESLGHEIKVITTDRDGKEGKFHVKAPLDTWTTYQGIPVIYCPTWPGPYLFSPSMRSVSRVAARGVEVIISSGTLWEYAGLLADQITRRYRIPHLVYPHGVIDPWTLQFKKVRKQIYWRLEARKILERAARIIALTEKEKEAIKQLGIQTPISVIPNGINSLDLSVTVSREELEKTYPQIKGRPYLLYMSRLHQKKGLDILIPAFSRVVKENNSDALLILAGHVDDIYRREFDKLLQDAASPNIMRVGHITGEMKNSLLRYATGFVLTSYSEGLPMAILEALAVGCPVIISRQCNLPEVGLANAGWVVETRTADVMQALTKLLEDPREAEIKGKNASRLALEKFSWEAIRTATDRILNEVCVTNDTENY